eukprot:1283108-Pleurochrysis_carterae.AAC.1
METRESGQEAAVDLPNQPTPRWKKRVAACKQGPRTKESTTHSKSRPWHLSMVSAAMFGE